MFSENTPIAVPIPPYDPAVLHPIRFFNDFDMTEDNKFLVTDSSYKYTRAENRKEVLDGAPRGRVFLFDGDATTVELRPILCGLHFPNGIQVLHRGDSPTEEVVIAELARFRLLRMPFSAAAVDTMYHQNKAAHVHLLTSCEEHGSTYVALKKQQGVRTFTDSFPGIPDNLRLDSHTQGGKSYYLVGTGAKSVQPFSLMWSIYQYTTIRTVVGKLVPMKWIEHFVPRYGLVVVVNEEGRIVHALHDPSGKVAMISQASRHPHTKDLWLGSHSEGYIAVVPSKYLPETWENNVNVK